MSTMKTVWFVDLPEDKGRMVIGYQVNTYTLYVKPGPFRIARFEHCFWPQSGLGYYTEVLMREFIRKWKRRIIEKKRVVHEVLYDKACDDVINHILKFAV